MAYGYVLASRKSDVIVLHDCDILSTTANSWRGWFIGGHPNINFEFLQGILCASDGSDVWACDTGCW